MADLSLYDDGEAFSAGDPPVESVDWDRVGHLQHRFDEAHNIESGSERKSAMLDLLGEMYGDELEVW